MKFKLNLAKILLFFRIHIKKIILGLLIICFIYAVLLFYYYAYLPLVSPSEISWEKVEIDQELYQKVIGDLEKREERINQGLNKIYPNPFSSP